MLFLNDRKGNAIKNNRVRGELRGTGIAFWGMFYAEREDTKMLAMQKGSRATTVLRKARKRFCKTCNASCPGTCLLFQKMEHRGFENVVCQSAVYCIRSPG